MIVDYTVVEKSSISTLRAAVNELIDKGYEPVGGVCACKDRGSFIYCQALTIRREPATETKEWVPEAPF